MLQFNCNYGDSFALDWARTLVGEAIVYWIDILFCFLFLLQRLQIKFGKMCERVGLHYQFDDLLIHFLYHQPVNR